GGIGAQRMGRRRGGEGRGGGVGVCGGRGALPWAGRGRRVRVGIAASVLPPPKEGMARAHFRNFLDCIRSGNRPNCDIEEGHKSTRLCHLGNIAYRTGRTLHFDAATETIREDPDASKLLGRIYRKPFIVPESV